MVSEICHRLDLFAHWALGINQLKKFTGVVNRRLRLLISRSLISPHPDHDTGMC